MEFCSITIRVSYSKKIPPYLKRDLRYNNLQKEPTRDMTLLRKVAVASIAVIKILNLPVKMTDQEH